MKTYSDDLAPHFEKLLERRAQELQAAVNASQHATEGKGEVFQGEVTDFKDAALEQSQAVVEDEQIERALEELEQVSTARRRLASQSFGYCLDCGNAIDLRRLEALPFTPFCIECQSAREQAAKGATGF